MKSTVLFHGSCDVIKEPQLGKGKITNDYGSGFYCTDSFDLAGEWACKGSLVTGIVNEYTINTENLKILDLSSDSYSILHWITILLCNRTFVINNPIAQEARDFLVANYSIDTSAYDIIIGYRADDSYFSFAEDFINNTITLEHLSMAMQLGKLGLQQVLVSKLAFEQLQFVKMHNVDGAKYNAQYLLRDKKARADYHNSKENKTHTTSGQYIIDIIRRNDG